MQKNKIEIKVFISCPSDVEEEKNIIKKVCDSISKMKDRNGIIVKGIDWRGNVVPHISEAGAQAIINQYLEDSDYDIYFGILWKRFGDAQRNGLTPTEEEFETALRNNKSEGKPFITVFFKEEDFYPHNKYETEQFLAVQNFRTRIQELDLGIYNTFTKDLDFMKSAFETIDHFVTQITQNELENTQASITLPKYDKVANYIKRKVCPSNAYNKDWMFYGLIKEKYDLLELIESENRIVILGDAGVGKTIELKRIASFFSEEKAKYVPIIVNLNHYVNQNLYDYLPYNWKTIPDYKLLLILDGLDEIESKNKLSAVRNIEFFSKQHPASNILVSCRSNFYQSGTSNLPGTLKDFNSYTLLPIDYSQIEEYVKSYLSIAFEDFISEINSLRLFNLLYIPFYLFEIVSLYNSQNRLPNNKSELFNEFIKLRFELDVLHFRTTIDLKNKWNSIHSKLHKIALCAEVLGRNYVTNDELTKIIPDDNERMLLKYCSLIKKNQEKNVESWQFEHNNIQEYLAAEILSTQPLNIVKSFISFAPDYKKIIPSWVNTLSFLSMQFPNDSLVDWILENELDIAVKFEPDKIENSTKIKIIKNIFEEHKNKKIWIDSDKYRYDELAQFCQADELIEYLLEEIESAQHYTIVSNGIEILGKVTIPSAYVHRFQNILVRIAIDDFSTKITPNVQQDALSALIDQKYTSNEVVVKIVSALKLSDNDWVRYGLYYFLHNSHFLDEYIDIFLEGIKYIRFKLNDSNNNRSRLMNERSELINGLKKVSKKESIQKMFNYFINNDRDIYEIFMGNHDITPIVKNTINIYKKSPTTFDIILNFVLMLFEKHHIEEANQFILFFDETDTIFYAFQKVMAMKNHNKEELLAALTTPECLSYFISKFDQNDISEEDVWNLLHTMKWRNKDMFNQFYDKLNEKYNNKFTLKPQPDWDKINKEKNQKEFDIVFNKSDFIAEIKFLYENEDKMSFTASQLLELKKDHFPEERYPHLIIRTLRNMAGKDAITFQDAVDNLDRFDWDWFAISHIYEKLSSNFKLYISDEQKEWIEKWCYSNENKVDFKIAITKDEENRYSTRWDAIYLWFFFKKFELSYSKETLLDMLSFDYQGEGIAYLEKYIAKRDISERILNNMNEGIEIEDVLKNHLEYCLENKIKLSLPFAIDKIKDEKTTYENRRITLDLILICGREYLEKILPEIKDSFKWVIIEELIGKSDMLYKYLKDSFQLAIPEEKYKLSNHLITYQDIDALKFYVSWIKTQNKFDGQMHEDSRLASLKEKSAIPYLLELLELTYQNDFKQVHPFDRLDQLVLASLTSISLESYNNYVEVIKSIEVFINDKIDLYENINWLHTYLNKLEQQYYVNFSQHITINGVIEKLKLIT